MIYPSAYSSVPGFLHLSSDIFGVGLSFCLCSVKPCGLELLGRYPQPPKYVYWLFLRVIQRPLGKGNRWNFPVGIAYERELWKMAARNTLLLTARQEK